MNRVAHVPTLDDLQAAGLLTDAEHTSAVARLRADRDWARPADVLLLVLGALLLLAGVVFFFAWNWNAIPKLARLGIVETGLIFCFAASLKTSDLTQRVLILAASVLVGVFLAVVGQIYQTGADPWRLFAAWALLITPWTFAAPFSITTLLLVTVTNLAVWLFYAQEAGPSLHATAFLALSVVNAGALAACEATEHGGKPVRHVLVLGALAPVTLGVVNGIVAPRSADLVMGNVLVWMALTAASGYGYRSLRPDVTALSFVALGICTVLLTFIGNLMLVGGDPGTFLLFTFICVAVFATAVYVLRRALPRGAA